MKNLYCFLTVFCFGMASEAQTINFTDLNFKSMLLHAATGQPIAFNDSNVQIVIDTNNNGEIEVTEAMLVKKLLFNGYHFENQPNVPLGLNGLEYFDAVESIVFDDKYIPYLDVSGMASLKSIRTYYTKIDTIHASGSNSLVSIDLANPSFVTTIDVSNAISLESLNCGYVQLHSLNVQGAVNLRDLYCGSNYFLNTLDLTGLTNLQNLRCQNNNMPALDVSTLTNLQTLMCGENNFTTLDVSGLANLKILNCRGTSHNNNSEGTIESLNLSGAISLEHIDCENNHITSLDASGLPHLITLICANNNLTSLNLEGDLALESLNCGENELTTLNVNALTNLTRLGCSDNHLTTLDVSHLSQLGSLFCPDNQLETLFIKNGSLEDAPGLGIYFYGNPNLSYICADDLQLEHVSMLAEQYGYTACEVNSYCSFAPGGTGYVINGSNSFDADTNGCDASDPYFPNLKFNITDGTNSGSLISDDSGAYSIYVNAGTHLITPVFENSDYFLVSPSSATVTFPAETSPFIQNFCITPLGVHNDLEVNIIPINQARPGFDATYKIVYKNKGNQTQSGTVSLAYNDAVIDFVSASVAPSSQPMNYINWNFTNLQPFEIKDFFITFNVNSPVETPPVNGGFVLNYTLCINSGLVDETPADNIFVLHQTVVNSFDPNEKLCLEGNTIAPEMIGKYVHYTIHFENSGTANAENIVVKDKIDTTKFDVSSLVPIAGSHPFVTKISDTNKVEFIFENINLPFDDANNDGFVAFKIKTNPTISVGDSFSNSASIYFDYNAPINTEPAVTAVQLLANADFEWGNTITITPNPADGLIRISNVTDPEFEVQISDLSGKIILQKNNSTQMDVSALAKGVYFIAINQGNRTITKKLIKN